MSADIQLIYTPLRGLVSPAREGIEQTLVITANNNEPSLPKVDGRVQYSYRGKRAAVTVHGKTRQGQISTPHITGLERPFWREFLESTEELESFRIVHSGFFGWDSDLNDLTVHRPLNTAQLARIELRDDYQATFQWRETLA